MTAVAVGTGMLVFGRMGGLVMGLPMLSAQGVPRLIQVLLAMAITVVLTPVVPPAMLPRSLGVLMLAMSAEVFLGLFLAAGVSAVFGAFALGTEIMGLQMGLGMARLFDPLVRAQEGLLGTLASWLAGLTFLGLGLHLECLLIVGESFHLIPPGAVALPWDQLPSVVPLVGKSILLGVQLAAPVLALVWLVNVFVAILAKLAPKMNVFFSIGMTISSVAGLGLVALALPWLIDTHANAMIESVQWLEAVLAGMAR